MLAGAGPATHGVRVKASASPTGRTSAAAAACERWGLLRGRACCGRFVVSAYGVGTDLTGGGWPGSVGHPVQLAYRGHPCPLATPSRQDGARRFEFQSSFEARWERKRRKARPPHCRRHLADPGFEKVFALYVGAASAATAGSRGRG